MEDDYTCTVRQDILKAMIGGTSFAVSTNESRIVHTGSLFEIGDGMLTIVSVDGFRLALRREKYEKLEGGAFTFVAPAVPQRSGKDLLRQRGRRNGDPWLPPCAVRGG